MKFRGDGFNWIVRLEKGEQLVESLTKLVQEQNIPSCWVNGIGGAAWAELGFYDLPNKTYLWQKVNEPLEIVSLQGNLAWDRAEPIFHIHATFARPSLANIGGHVKELEVAGTCEIFLHRWYGETLTRSQNTEVGLKTLDL